MSLDTKTTWTNWEPYWHRCWWMVTLIRAECMRYRPMDDGRGLVVVAFDQGSDLKGREETSFAYSWSMAYLWSQDYVRERKDRSRHHCQQIQSLLPRWNNRNDARDQPWQRRCNRPRWESDWVSRETFDRGPHWCSADDGSHLAGSDLFHFECVVQHWCRWKMLLREVLE